MFKQWGSSGGDAASESPSEATAKGTVTEIRWFYDLYYIIDEDGVTKINDTKFDIFVWFAFIR